MRRAVHDATACREVLLRLPKLRLGELRQQWRVLYKAEASPYLSRELLLRAVAYRMQEVALGGLRPEAASAPSICSAAQREPRGADTSSSRAEAWNSAGSRMAG